MVRSDHGLTTFDNMNNKYLLTLLCTVSVTTAHGEIILSSSSDRIAQESDRTTVIQRSRMQAQLYQSFTAQTPSLFTQPVEERLHLGSQDLVNNPSLLRSVMRLVVRQGNIAAIEKLLPLYQRLQEADPLLIAYAQGLLYLQKGEAGKSVQAFKTVLDSRPDAEVAQFYYAIANFYNKDIYQSEKDLLSLLTKADLPAEIQQNIQSYQAQIKKQKEWKWLFSINPFYDRNINNAPDQQKSGGFIFEKPIADWGVNYQLGIQKRLFIPKGFYLEPSAYVNGKQFLKERRYNDVYAHLTLSLGYANQYSDVAVQPYWNRRFYSNKGYSHASGAQVQWLQNWSARIATFVTLGYEREKYDQHYFFNNQKQIVNIGQMIALTPEHSLLLNQSFVKQYGTRDKEDRYLDSSFGLSWTASWQNGLNTELAFLIGKTKYAGPNLLTQGQNRRDTRRGVSLKIQYAKWQIAGFTPELRLRYHHYRSNSLLHNYTKRDIGISFSKSF